MAKRKVMRKRVDLNKDVQALCNPMEPWSPRLKDNAIIDIEQGTHSYYIDLQGKEINVVVAYSKSGKKLITDPKQSTHNLLLDLQDC